jgi:hypothetical protein
MAVAFRRLVLWFGLSLGLASLLASCAKTGLREQIDAGPKPPPIPSACSDDEDCDDGLACTGVERCEAGVCALGEPPVCDDAVACTVDGCVEPMGTCESLPDTSRCPDALVCLPGEGCATLPCIGDADCDDAFFCNGAEVCVGGLCAAGDAPDCDDGLECTVDLCRGDACIHAPRPDVACDAGMPPCSGTDCCVPSMESCTNGVDDDCDGLADCADPNCADQAICCVPSFESCTNGVDDDCDGLADCADPDCADQAICCVPSPESCTNGQDDDCDGLVDCDDPACDAAFECFSFCLPFEACIGGLDLDCDGLDGCVDPDCFGFCF